jgi:hypothetical protein
MAIMQVPNDLFAVLSLVVRDSLTLVVIFCRDHRQSRNPCIASTDGCAASALNEIYDAKDNRVIPAPFAPKDTSVYSFKVFIIIKSATCRICLLLQFFYLVCHLANRHPITMISTPITLVWIYSAVHVTSSSIMCRNGVLQYILNLVRLLEQYSLVCKIVSHSRVLSCFLPFFSFHSLTRLVSNSTPDGV